MITKDTPHASDIRLVFLGRGTGQTHAEEIKSLGLKVGDVIRGKQGSGITGGSWWHEVRLTVIWAGEKEVVYRKQWRASYHLDGWYDEGEVSNFSLSCREYYLEENEESIPIGSKTDSAKQQSVNGLEKQVILNPHPFIARTEITEYSTDGTGPQPERRVTQSNPSNG